MALTLPNTLANGTNADASKVQENFVAVRDHINTEVIHRNGSIAFTQPQAGVTPTEGSHLATKAYSDAQVTDSGTVNVTLHPSFSGTFFVRKIGRVVWMVLAVSYDGGGVSDTSVEVGTIPDGYRPSSSIPANGVTSVDTAQRGTVAAGTGVYTFPSLTIATGQVLQASASWWV